MSFKYKYCKTANADSLLVVLSAFNQDKFMGYKTLKDSKQNKFSFLFLTDPLNTYYLNNNLGLDYFNLLDNYIPLYDPKNIIFHGSSMSGFAAIFMAIKYNANFIVNNPQIDLALSISPELCWQDLRKAISVIEPKLDLPKYLMENYKDSCGYIIHGYHRLDLANINLLCSLKMEKMIMFDSIDTVAHDYLFSSIIDVIDIGSILIQMRYLK